MTGLLYGVLIAIAFSALLFTIISFRNHRGLEAAYGILATIFLGSLPLMFAAGEKANVANAAFLESIDEDTPSRPAKAIEIARYGADASKGIVVGSSNQRRRLHCITYFDGEKAAFLFRYNPSNKSEHVSSVDLEICQRAGAFSSNS